MALKIGTRIKLYNLGTDFEIISRWNPTNKWIVAEVDPRTNQPMFAMEHERWIEESGIERIVS